MSEFQHEELRRRNRKGKFKCWKCDREFLQDVYIADTICPFCGARSCPDL